MNIVSNVINAANAALGNAQGSGFAEDESFETRDKIFEEFNTLSVIYGKPADEFVKKRTIKMEIPTASHDGSQHVDEKVLFLPFFYILLIFFLFLFSLRV